MPPRFQRRRTDRPIKPRRVIFVEGQTEEQYFNALKQIATTVTVDPRFKKSPADMAKEAKKVIRDSWNKSRDELWFVLDSEEPNNRPTPEYWRTLTQFCNTHPNINTGICISNICFETWLLAHFKNQGLNQNVQNLQRSLTSALGYNYHKGKLKVGDFLPRISTALQNCNHCLLYTSPSPRDLSTSRMPSSA